MVECKKIRQKKPKKQGFKKHSYESVSCACELFVWMNLHGLLEPQIILHLLIRLYHVMQPYVDYLYLTMDTIGIVNIIFLKYCNATT